MRPAAKNTILLVLLVGAVALLIWGVIPSDSGTKYQASNLLITAFSSAVVAGIAVFGVVGLRSVSRTWDTQAYKEVTSIYDAIRKAANPRDHVYLYDLGSPPGKREGLLEGTQQRALCQAWNRIGFLAHENPAVKSTVLKLWPDVVLRLWILLYARIQNESKKYSQPAESWMEYFEQLATDAIPAFLDKVNRGRLQRFRRRLTSSGSRPLRSWLLYGVDGKKAWAYLAASVARTEVCMRQTRSRWPAAELAFTLHEHSRCGEEASEGTSTSEPVQISILVTRNLDWGNASKSLYAAFEERHPGRV